ncbi:MAG: RDD family protein [Acidobacteriaceae bacterium]|nr:RDD family protein [Acidobacteriaceae bacterium]
MTCQHCQTWILDDDHRCRRCGRRVRATPSRISPETYPLAAAATAPGYDFEGEPNFRGSESEISSSAAGLGQQILFTTPANQPRVIPFDSLTSPAERDAIRLRAAEAQRPAPVKSAKVEAKRSRSNRNSPSDQRGFDFHIHEEASRAPDLYLPTSDVICAAPVATAAVRVQAALLDALLIACGSTIGLGLFFYIGGHFTADKHVLPFASAALLTVPLFYKLLWVFAGQDTPGTRMSGLELVDFDGKRPSKGRRFQRLFGSVLSLLAAGIGMIWALVDEDKLTWHDHISGTFPTFSDQNSPV